MLDLEECTLFFAPLSPQVLRNREIDAAKHVAESEAQQLILITSQEALSSSTASLKVGRAGLYTATQKPDPQ